ncbi:hypothetical protein ACFZC5_34860 [Nocardia gamkensis]|uniref:hypothetical protein n=1 Tax=Nocardia gamkensis TaxID=352869 RepID=UPI0036E7066C
MGEDECHVRFFPERSGDPVDIDPIDTACFAATAGQAGRRRRSGQPTRSTGALTCCNSLPKQGDKLWVLTHKYPDLQEEFAKQRDDVSGIPQAFQHLQARVLDLDNKTLRAENADLTTRANTYAQVIQESTAEPDPRRTEPLSSVCLVPTQAERG